MTARIRNLGLAGIVIGGSVIFGVGFAGAQAPSTTPEAPKETRVVSSDTVSPTGGGGGGCDHGEVKTAVNAADY
jgi:hypothetical protein